MFKRFLTSTEFPAQFWLMFWGLLISTVGASMVWPFLMIYVSGKLQLPLTAVAGLMTANSISGLVSSFLVGPVIDRLGRKTTMVVSLFLNGLVYLFYTQAASFWGFLAVMMLAGAVNPLYRVAADAMMADLVIPEHRMEGYSLLRMSNNLGVAIGPAVGGFIATRSYTIAFILAAAGMITYSILMLLRGRETLPAVETPRERERLGGYDRVFSDQRYIRFIGSTLLTIICATMMWVMLSVYTKQNFGLSESLYGWLPTTNGLMIILLQMPITRWTSRHDSRWMMMLGAFFYTIGVGSVALGTGFWGFWASMVVMTIGEMIFAPTTNSFAANMAPADMRGRYMSLYTLTWSVSQGIGPIFGGMLNDLIAPVAIWYGAGVVGVFSVLAFYLISRKPGAANPA